MVSYNTTNRYPAALLSREAEGTALRSLGNQFVTVREPGANSGRTSVLEDKRWLVLRAPSFLQKGAFFAPCSWG
jgi:hypothetical protein